jgi:hypothetical protein
MSADDGWREMDAVPKAGKRLPGCSLHGVLTRGKSPQRRLSLCFRLDILPGDVAEAIAGANRFSCAFSERLGALRLRPGDMGRFEMSAAPRGGGARAAAAPAASSGFFVRPACRRGRA